MIHIIKLGFLAGLLSRPIFIGLLSGVSIIIAGQLGKAFRRVDLGQVQILFFRNKGDVLNAYYAAIDSEKQDEKIADEGQ
ncbi:MAG: hypothetical protein ACRCWR_08025 [Saezia sp.]